VSAPRKSAAGLVAGLVLIALAGCDNLPGKPKPEDRPIRPDRVEKFSELFAANCAGCHGAEGKLGPAPPLNDPLFLKIVPDEELLMTISSGRQDTLMPAFARSHPGGTLTPNQVITLAEGLKKEWGKEVNLKGSIPDYSVSAAKAGDVAAGQKVYQTACALCHGKQGEGTAAAGAINRSAFLTLISDQALRRIVITGRPDLGMPNFAETAGRPEGFKPLTNQDVSDIMALLASWRQKGLSTFK
jgi:cytochrome c oxidase cbb3-type subunit 3